MDFKNFLEIHNKGVGKFKEVPGFFDAVMSYVSQGGSLLDVCRELDISYGTVIVWIRDDKNRNDAYNNALLARTESEIERLKRELAAISGADPRMLFDAEGKMLPPRLWPDDVARFVGGYEVDKLGRPKVKQIDKIRAIEVYGKTLAMFVEKIEVTGKLTLAQLLEKSWEKSGEENGSGSTST